MPTDKSDAQKAREVQDKPVYRRTCSICVRQFYDSLIGPCPERDGRQVCMYCCRRLCDQSYTLPGQIGQRCRARDAERKKGKKTKPEPSESGSGLERTTGRNLRAATGGGRDAFRPRRTT